MVSGRDFLLFLSQRSLKGGGKMKSVLVCSRKKQNRLDRILTNDPGLGIARVDAGYERGERIAKESNIPLPQ